MKKTPFGFQVRHFTALVSAFIYNLNIFGLSARNICAPGFNCHGCPWATFSCPIGVVGYGFGVRAIPAFALGTILAIAVVCGRLVCGFACPVGLAQEVVYKIPGKKFKIPRFFRYFKYVILFLTVFFLTFLFGYQPKTGYIKVEKPEISKYPPAPKVKTGGFGAFSSFGKPTLDSAAKSDSSADSHAAADKKFCPVPQELLKGNGLNTSESLNTAPTFGRSIKPLGLSSPQAAATGKPPASVKLNNLSETPPPSGNNFKKLKNLDIFGSSNTKTETAVAKETAPEPFHKSITQKTNLLKVEMTVVNISDKPIDGFSLSAAFYAEDGSSQPGSGIVWQAPEDRRYENKLAPGDSIKLPPFLVPNMLDKGGLVVTSPQSKVKLDYWPLFCTYCPVAVFEADLPARISNGIDLEQMFYQTTSLNIPRLLITLFVVIACIFVSRFFCRVICPLGAIYAIFHRFSILRIEVKDPTCVSCMHCNSVCPVEFDVATEAGGPECISCGSCINKCPSSAISRKFGIK